MHTKLVAALLLGLLAPLCAAEESTTQSPRPVTYNPDTRPGRPYEAPVQRPKHSRHTHVSGTTNSVAAVAGSTADTAPVTYNPDTRPGAPYETGTKVKPTKKKCKKHRKCGRGH